MRIRFLAFPVTVSITTLSMGAVLGNPPDDSGSSCAIGGMVFDASILYQPEYLEAAIPPSGQSEIEMRSFYDDLLASFTGQSRSPLKEIRVTLEGANNDVKSVTATDKKGRFLFKDLAPGAYTVRATPPEHAVRLKKDAYEQSKFVKVAPGQSVDDADMSFRFDGISITGRVIDSTGNGVSEALVTIDPAEVPAGESGGIAGTGVTWNQSIERVETITDSDGFYRIDNMCPASFRDALKYLGGSLPISTYAITAQCDGYSSCRVTVPVVTAQLAEIAQNAVVQFQRINKAIGFTDGPPQKAADVRFAETSGSAILVDDLVLAAASSISGRVLDTRGQSMNEWYFALVPLNRPESKPFVCETVVPGITKTGTQGEFRFNAVPPGSYHFAIHDQWGRMSQRARNDAVVLYEGQTVSNIEVRVESEADRGGLDGRVVNHLTNEPVAGLNIQVQQIVSPSEPSPVPGEISIDADNPGRFGLSHTSPGTVTLRIIAPGYPASIVDAVVESGRVREVELAIDPASAIEGIVTLNEEPIGGTVHLYRTDGMPVLMPDGREDILMSAEIDAAGQFRLAGLGASDYVVHVNAITGKANTTYFRHITVPVTVAPDEVATLNCSIVGSATIQGTFTFPDYYARGRVHLFPGRIESIDKGLPSHQYVAKLVASTERMYTSGPFVFSGLPAGDYTVMGFCYNNRNLQGEAWEMDRPRVYHTIQVRASEVKEFDFAMR